MKFVCALALLIGLTAGCGPQKKFCVPKTNGGTGDAFGNCPVPVNDAAGSESNFIGDDAGPSDAHFIGTD